MAPRLPVLVVALLLLGAGGGVGIWRVTELERLELEEESEPRTLREAAALPGSTAGNARLMTVALRRGEHVVVELCADDGLPPGRWGDAAELAVWEPEAQELLARLPLTAEALEGARRNDQGACITVARGVVPRDGEYAVEAVFPQGRPDAIADVPVRARALARVPLGTLERISVALALVGALGLLFALALGSRPTTVTTSGGRRGDALVRLAMGVALVLGAAAAVAALPIGGSAGSLAGGLAFAMVEVVAAVLLVPRVLAPADGDAARERPTRAEALGLVRPRRGWGRIAAVTALAAVALVAVARVSIALVPSTGEAPIQTFVSWPSGLLSFALLAVLVPVAEELFFRGFVYSAALPLGRVAAFVLAAGLFVAAHAPQVWGGWGGLVAVTATGVGLTALRAWTGSILPGAAAHLAYNALLAAGAVF